MSPDRILFPFFISSILDAEGGWNVLNLQTYRYSEFIGITFAFPRRSRKLAWMKVGLLCLALSGGQWVAIQKGSTRDPGNGF